jgi:glycosidase
LPVNPNYRTGINVAAQEDDPRSLLHFYRRMLRLRRTTPALLAGDYHALHPHSDAYLAFLRQDAATGQTCLVVLNFSDTAQTVVFELRSTQPRLLFSSQARADKPLSLTWLPVAPFEICIIEVT